jgi:hypothetical protein
MTKPASAPPADALPPLPEPCFEASLFVDGKCIAENYTADQMREYARAAIAASAQVREVEANCRGSWQLGNNCKRCPRCLSTMPAAEPAPVAQGDVDRAFLTLTREDSTPEEIEARMFLMRYIAALEASQPQPGHD